MKSFDPWSVIMTDEFGDVVWPRPYYGHSFYREVPSWIHYGDDGSRWRRLFDGAFIGAEGPFTGAADPLQALEINTMMQPHVYSGHRLGAVAPSPASSESRRGLLAEVAPHVAPATGPISVKKLFDDRQVLHVEICVDGKCYRTSMNLGPAIQLVMEKLAQWHRDQHASMGQPASMDTTAVVGAIDDAIGAAGDAMADTLVCRHVNVMTAGFFDDVGSAIGGTLRKLEPVISTVATGVATYYGGPEAGAAAGKLAPVVTNLQANLLDPKGDPQQRATAQQNLQRVNQVAQANPRAAQALAAAHQAVRDTAIAYHVKDTVDKAVSGDRGAQQNVAAVVQAADRGDPAAKSTYEVIAQTLLNQARQSEWGQQLWDKIMGSGSNTAVSAGWYSAPVTVGSFWDDVGNAVLTITGTKATNQFIHDHGLEPYVKFASQAVATYYGGPAAGAAAGAISPMVMSLGVEDKNKAVAAQQDVQGVRAVAAQHSPQMAQAVDVAQGSIQGVATAYHLNHMLKLARGGDAISRKTLDMLRARALGGDPSAQKAMQAINAIHQGQQTAGPAVSGWYDVVGAVIHAGGASRRHHFDQGWWR